MNPVRPSIRPARKRWALLVLGMIAVLSACTGGGRPHHHPASSSASTTPGALKAGSRPNIVFVLTDDLSSNLVPYMPHVNALMRRGASFGNYFVVDSLCCPSRSAIFTGEYPHDDGVFTNSGRDGGYGAFNRFGNQSKTFAVALHNAGYTTAMMGKYLNGYYARDPEPPGWDDWFVAGNGYHEFNYDVRSNNKVSHHGNAPTDYLGDQLDTQAQKFLDKATGNGKPFALEVATFAPHGPYVPAPRDLGTFPGLTVPRTPAYNLRDSVGPAWLADRAKITPLLQKAMDVDFERRVEAVQDVDRMIGNLERTLRERGALDNTYFVFSSDNGYHMGDHRLLPGKQTAFDTDIRVPLVIAGPGIKPETKINDVTESIDLAPTFEAIGGLQAPSWVDGRSLLPLLQGTAGHWPQQAALIEHHAHRKQSRSDPDLQSPASGVPPSYEAIRTANALYVEYVTGDREYYNLRTDPYEIHNLIHQTPASVLTAMSRWLHALENCHGSDACTVASQGRAESQAVSRRQPRPRR
jgi:arylsulfatase A-like enzyme